MSPETWWLAPERVGWTRVLLDSFHRWTGDELIERRGSDEDQADALFAAPFVVVSHGTEADPILNYANRVALELWEMEWPEFSRTPSRLTAEPVNRAERERMLAEAAARGVFADYRGVRISRSGRRFLVENALVWNLLDAHDRPRGQAATFSRWTFL
jgi:hypothetical protein